MKLNKLLLSLLFSFALVPWSAHASIEEGEGDTPKEEIVESVAAEEEEVAAEEEVAEQEVAEPEVVETARERKATQDAINAAKRTRGFGKRQINQ